MKNYFGFPAGHLANFVLPIAFIVQCLQNRVPTSLIKLRKENQTFNKALPSLRCVARYPAKPTEEVQIGCDFAMPSPNLQFLFDWISEPS